MATREARIQVPCTLTTPQVQSVLDRLYRNAKQIDQEALAKANPVTEGMHGDDKFAVRSELLKEAYLPIPRDVGQLLYMLARTHPCRTIVEFGTSFAISTIHLASAVRDNGGGKVIATELHADKARRATENLREAGLLDLVELRVGDARETLRAIDGEVDFAFIDGWKELYLPVLQLIEPRLRPGALVVADNLNMAGEILRGYVDYVSAEENGYIAVQLPIGDRLSVALRLGRR
ncbi:MAG TPA: class I SAM-dependent methyltransferase [Candidatus Aquilonibacter sp.]|nr:class I SAM-dependent methyltransferase [Candidatus Aquilonibacter sp.]